MFAFQNLLLRQFCRRVHQSVTFLPSSACAVNPHQQQQQQSFNDWIIRNVLLKLTRHVSAVALVRAVAPAPAPGFGRGSGVGGLDGFDFDLDRNG
jgi:hypothetical protein